MIDLHMHTTFSDEQTKKNYYKYVNIIIFIFQVEATITGVINKK